MAHDAEIGERLFRIRAACGNGERDPETLEAFARRVRKATGSDYSPVTLSMIERGKRRWLVADINTFADVDPLERGREWLAFGAPAEAEPEEEKPRAKISRPKRA